MVLTLGPADVMLHTEENLDVTSYGFWILSREEILLDFVGKLNVIERTLRIGRQEGQSQTYDDGNRPGAGLKMLWTTLRMGGGCM